MNFEQEIQEKLKDEEITEEEREKLLYQLKKIQNRELPSSDSEDDYMYVNNTNNEFDYSIKEEKVKKFRKRKEQVDNTIKFDHKKKGRVFNPKLPPPGDKFKPIKKAGFNMVNDDFPSL